MSLENLQGFRNEVVTFKATTSSVEEGKLVRPNAEGVAVCATEGELFMGKVLSRRGNYASILMGGIITMPYTGNSMGIGYQRLVSGANGASVKIDETNGRHMLILAMDEDAETVDILL